MAVFTGGRYSQFLSTTAQNPLPEQYPKSVKLSFSLIPETMIALSRLRKTRSRQNKISLNIKRININT